MMHGLWTIAEAAALIGVGPGTLYAWVRLGRIAHLEQEDLVLLRGTDLDEWFDGWSGTQIERSPG